MYFLFPFFDYLSYFRIPCGTYRKYSKKLREIEIKKIDFGPFRHHRVRLTMKGKSSLYRGPKRGTEFVYLVLGESPV